jgi:hypothetical protein
MGWSGRAPAPPASEAGKGAKDKEHIISQPPIRQATIRCEIVLHADLT